MRATLDPRPGVVVSNRNPLDLVERNLILSLVVELRRSRRLVVGDVLRGFEGSIVLQVRGYVGRPGRYGSQSSS